MMPSGNAEGQGGMMDAKYTVGDEVYVRVTVRAVTLTKDGLEYGVIVPGTWFGSMSVSEERVYGTRPVDPVQVSA